MVIVPLTYVRELEVEVPVNASTVVSTSGLFVLVYEMIIEAGGSLRAVIRDGDRQARAAVAPHQRGLPWRESRVNFMCFPSG
jgi:hypothetical protein